LPFGKSGALARKGSSSTARMPTCRDATSDRRRRRTGTTVVVLGDNGVSVAGVQHRSARASVEGRRDDADPGARAGASACTISLAAGA
jgi:hypothetical protein